MQPNSRWWHPERHAERRPFLLARTRVLRAVRTYFEADGFVEVESGALQVSPGNETHLHGFATEWMAPDGERWPLYLHTSPEFGCKKLLAAGEELIFSLGPVFRNRELSRLHSPEFTMLEWYRANEPYDRIMADCAALLAVAADAVGSGEFRWRAMRANPFAAPERLTVADAFRAYADLDLQALMPDDAQSGGARDAFAAACADRGIRVVPDDNWSDLFSRMMAERIEPRLGMGRGTVLYEYPASEAALARRKQSDPRFAERFELYVCGVELANAFGELTDPAEQRLRFEADMAEKQRIYGELYPVDEDFLAALASMPPASGAALGFDRLVMLATGAAHIDQVLWTPFALAGPGKRGLGALSLPDRHGDTE